MMQASGRGELDWSADYRVFSRGEWNAHELFRSLIPSIVRLGTDQQSLLVASLDDTHVRKTGTKIPGVSYKRDPMSPPFQTNLIRAQRFVQASLAIPFHPGPSPCRAIPVAFDHAPSAPKPRAKATAEERTECRRQQKQKRLSLYGAKAIRRLREDLDRSGTDTRLLVGADGSYTNRTVLRQLPDRTDFIGRIRKDAVLHFPPDGKATRGRPRSYGERAPTPEHLRQDESIPWQTVKIFAAAREHDCDIKELAPLLWRKAGLDLPLRLIIIRPLAYRRTKGERVRYRDPAYLITTNLTLSVQMLVQAYFWRWDIEVNHRDEKQIIGVGQAQVRSEKSAERVPAFAVACYSMLLMAAARAFGLSASGPIQALPKWLASAAARQIRIPTPQLIAALRAELMASTMNLALPNFSHFARRIEYHMKCPKGALSTAEAIHYAMN